MKVTKIYDLKLLVDDLKSETERDVVWQYLIDFNNSKSISGYQGKSQSYLKIKEISYFWSENKLLYCQYHGTKYRIESKLENISMLDPILVRINKSMVVNITCIKRIKPELNCKHKLVLDDGNIIYVSRHYLKQTLETIGDYYEQTI